ncbi:PepSY domain-containing protein [Umezawaea sp.]|uniref:PepSY domain-containing protein n=1 Tax=Umezawaea sp. TaxID=1955258 RepID=UPI002ED01B8A
MSNWNRAALVGGTLALLVTAGTAAAAFTGSDGTVATTGGTSTSVRSTTASAPPSTSTSSAAPSSSAAAGLTAEEAERKALDEVGGGRVERSEREWEHGRWVWHVRIEGQDGRRHDVRVDEETGEVCADGRPHGPGRGHGSGRWGRGGRGY